MHSKRHSISSNLNIMMMMMIIIIIIIITGTAAYLRTKKYLLTDLI
jgi:hypothetical protein